VRLQLFKTNSKGWGLRCLDDVAMGTFLCIYAGELLSEDQSDARGLELGDEYFADLDYIEYLKNDFFKLKSADSTFASENEDDAEEVREAASTKQNKKRSKKDRKKVDENDQKSFRLLNENSFFARLNRQYSFEQHWSNSNIFVLDAKMCGNIGRYFNHSCSPNVHVQSVFVDTYDLRFPWIAFFSSRFLRAGTELCWDYNYTIGSLEDRQLLCHCGSAYCRGRLL
jgi:histone-lysine N-methyltransferase SETDB1